jgi:hypothetical protein
MVAGVASGGGGRQFSVREGCTRWRGTRGGDGEFGVGQGGATRWLDSGGRNQQHRGGDGPRKKKGGFTVGGGRPL